MNIDTTRHQEIQVVGNGEWCVTMGGRDCSLQMHEQKLLEVSITQEELQTAIQVAEAAGKTTEAAQLKKDLAILERMEHEGAVFGKAVKLDSLGTFECIVDGDSHYFMEMNTRIQVEHRVTELCYALKFTNPADANDFFVVESLVEVMALIAHHGKKLPEPVRIPRNNTSVEARLNATNHALQPHAGGVIKQWSDPLAGEIRDDQGISLHNPDTNVFMQYHLAGAYDSNIALLLSVGSDRMASYCKMAEILRQTKLTGENLSTNLEFHYGLVNWFIGNGINARPTTRFIVPYLTAIGLLTKAAKSIDVNFAGIAITTKAVNAAGDDEAMVYAIKQASATKATLLPRAISALLDEAHILAGWLSTHQNSFTIDGEKVSWLENPVDLLADIYHFLAMDYDPKTPALNQMWEQDHLLLQDALSFYSSVKEMSGVSEWLALDALLKTGAAPAGIDAEKWQQAQAAHAGYQFGMDLLSVLPHLAIQSGFFDLKVNDDLSLHIPELLEDKDLQADMAIMLAPPPVAKSDEVLALSGGMFYSREAPGMDQFVTKGSHFNAGDPLYIVEVMKMFNKVYAPFAGTVTEVVVDSDAQIIKKGELLFKVKPDVELKIETAGEIKARKQAATAKFLATL